MTNSNAKILLIEDDSAIATTLRRILTDEGYDIVIETTGEGGLARVKNNVFDVVITDLKLPGMSGLELVRALHPEKPRLPILMMTAHGTTESAIEAIQAGAFEYRKRVPRVASGAIHGRRETQISPR